MGEASIAVAEGLHGLAPTPPETIWVADRTAGIGGISLLFFVSAQGCVAHK